MLRDLLTLSRKEQVAFLVLFVLLVIFAGAFFITRPVELTKVDEALVAWADSVRYIEKASSYRQPDTVFYFNPNSEGVKNLQLLGFSDRTIINLIKYREAGGVFTHAEKLRKIYGMDSVLYARLAPYVKVDQMPSKVSATARRVEKVSSPRPVMQFVDSASKRKMKAPTVDFQLEINSADTAMLALLKGIGPVLSARIVSYRKRLGGYYNIEQLDEVYGLSGEVVDRNRSYLLVDEGLIQPMDIGKASLRKMKNHPYLNFYMAREIYEARKAGQLESIMQFQNSAAFAGADMDKLRRYFVVMKADKAHN
ncbi:MULTISPECIES: helix-hairpin-helix domain-containing protein [unclassified Carboxylicivirga]|uniref:helix-hairpin-helix domain-containing protein n=1 Tax=Carboxylicivirga TaxID=1628153 RepID=UPI003D3572D9